MTADKTKTANDLVVVGSSADGIGALSTLVGTLNKAFPAPIVLAQHLDPQRPSHLGAILERRSTLPIVVVSEDSPTPLENGKIFVVPSNRHVKIVDGHVQLEANYRDGPKPSVDMLLSSAAQSYAEHLIAVILTGSGSDGAVGAVDVKNAGGVVIIQNPQTAPYPSMPLSLPPTAVDHVVEMEQIGPLLYDLLKGVDIPEQEKAEDPLRDLLAQVSDRTNIDFRNYKSSTILRRISRRMAVTHNASISEYIDYLRTHHDEVEELVKAFLFLGKAETARPTKAAFELINKRWKIYRCISGPVHFQVQEGAMSQGSMNSWREIRRRPASAAPLPGPTDPPPVDFDIAQLRRINETVLRYTTVAIVIIDSIVRTLR